MNIKNRIRELVTLADYENCWNSENIPPFDDFFISLADRITEIVNDSSSDLTLEISRSSEGRINVGGSFETAHSKMRIWGQIVWLPKPKRFRGKLGASEVESPRTAPKDESSSFTLVEETSSDLNFYCTSLELKPIQLKGRFGEPSEADNFKVSGIYIFEGDVGSAFRIHDYEATSLYWDEKKYPGFPSKDEFWCSSENYEFTIAGSHEASSFISWLQNQLV